MNSIDCAEPSKVVELSGLNLLCRLKHVSQAGAPALVRPTRTVTRYEHSVGVASIAERLSLPPIYQIAALLHDATHTPFSHTIDYMLGAVREDTHETRFADLAVDRELVAVLGDSTVATIVELLRSKPEWLAHIDAIDYTLRDLDRARLLGAVDELEVIDGLGWSGEHVLFPTPGAAAWFMGLMSFAGGILYMDPLDLYRHRRLADIISTALESDVVTYTDVVGSDDHQLLRKLCRHQETRRQLSDFRHLSADQLRERRDGSRITSKCRIISPWTLDRRGKIVRAVEVSERCRMILASAQARSAAGVPLLTKK